MVIVYHGKVESLKQDLAKEQARLNQRYVEVLGEERAKKVEDIASRVLTSESFIDTREAYKRTYDYDLAENAPCKFGVASLSDLEVRADGHIKERKVGTSPFFYISEEAFKHSSYSKVTDRLLATFIHEYNHFIFYALQNPPVFVANYFMYNHLKPRKRPFDLEDFAQQLKDEGVPQQEQIKKIMMASQASLIEEAYEQATRILDKSILGSIDIHVSLSWRNMPRGMIPTCLPTGQIIATGYGGDMFSGLLDSEVIRRYIEWNQYFSQRLVSSKGGGVFVRNPEEGQYITNLIDSLRELKVSRMPVQDIRRLQERGKKRRK